MDWLYHLLNIIEQTTGKDHKTKNIKGSRSGKAIQSKHPYMSGLRYKPTSYISPILRKLRDRLIRG